MTRSRQAGRGLAISLAVFIIASPILTYFFDKRNYFGALFAVPLLFVTRLYGKRIGLWIAALGVALNAAVWFALGDGLEVLHSNAASAALAHFVEISGFLAIIIAVDKLSKSRKETEEAKRLLADSERRYRTLVELAPEGIVVFSEDKVRFFNNRILEWTGYSETELMGMPMPALVHKEDIPTALERYTARIEGIRAVPTSTLRHLTKGGEVKWVQATGQRIEWEGNPAVMYILTDITEQKALEDQAVQSQKMEAIGRLAGGVAHDFNNILQVILGSCSLLEEHPEDGLEVIRNTQAIKDSANRAGELTRQLLAFSRKQLFQPKVLDISQIVQNSELMLNRVLGEDIHLTVQVDEEPSYVKADAGQLQQVIMNLAANARDAMPEGGRLIVSVENDRREVRLMVADTGRGMDERTIAHIFEPFFTTKEVGKGTGLGLSIVYGIVEKSKGHISVDSRPGFGSRFTITLPRIEGIAEDAAATVLEPDSRGSGSILLVEDEDAVRKMLRKILERGGYGVTEASSGEKALEICRSHSEGFDLLLTDVVMQGIRGTDLAAASRSLLPKMPVIYMTGYAQVSISEYGNSAVLQKPFSASELLVEVRRTLGQVKV